MSSEQDQIEAELRNAFSDYDQTVDVVSCWQSFADFQLKGHIFFRFGKFQNEAGSFVTPDFAVANRKDESLIAGPGSFICDVKKVPNPFPENSTDIQLEQAQARFGASVTEVFKYSERLKYVSQHFGLPQLTFSEHDVVLLTPAEVSDNVYNFLKKNLPSPFNVGRPLVLVEYLYNQGDNLERYVFKWKQGESNSPFSNSVLRTEMIEKAQPMRGYPRHFIPYKIRHITCNDPVPPVYLLSFLWVEVFVKLLTEDQFDEWQQTSTGTTVQIELTIGGLVEMIRKEYATSLNSNDIRRALDELVKIKKAKIIDRGIEKYSIAYSNLAGRVFLESEGDQKGVQKKLELREYGRVFAGLLANKDIKQPPPVRSRSGRGRKPKGDYPWLPFDK